MMIDLLQAVVTEGTGKAARIPNATVAGKTGTTQEYRDAWFIGFSQDLIVGVWVGNDDNTPTNKVTGGDVPASIWHDFVTRAAPMISKAPQQVAKLPAGALSPSGTQSANQSAASANPSVSALANQAAGVRGPAEVVDTATLGIRGRRIELLGIVGADDRRTARPLARFLRRQEVACDPVGVAEKYRCRVNGQDLAEIILSNGGARASSNAPPELLAAEEEARAARLGIWRQM